jgi:hypothetical protein
MNTLTIFQVSLIATKPNKPVLHKRYVTRDRYSDGGVANSYSYSYVVTGKKTFIRNFRFRQYVPLKRLSTVILHGSTSQKTNLNFILAAMRT